MIRVLAVDDHAVFRDGMHRGAGWDPIEGCRRPRAGVRERAVGSLRMYPLC